MGIRDKIGLGGKAKAVPNDRLAEQRHECYAFHILLCSLRDDAKQMQPVLHSIALKESKATELAKSILEADKASWTEFEKVTKQYAEGYSAVYRHYESETRPQLEKLVFDLENNITAASTAIKKIEKRDALHGEMVEAAQDVEKLTTAGKNSAKAETAHTKCKEKFDESTTELTTALKSVLANRKGFLASSLQSLVGIQTKFYSVVQTEIGKCDSASL